MSNSHNKQLRTNQSGLVSFFVVMIIMAILTLIVLAYAQITRREQRQSLDRQLSSQAFFAAESGVNDAITALKSNSTLRNTDYTECDDFQGVAGLNTTIDATTSYSCLLVDPTPTQLTYDGMAAGKSQVIRIQPKPGSPNLRNLHFIWSNVEIDNAAEKSGCPSAEEVNNGDHVFAPQAHPQCDHAVLRVELVQFNGPTNRNQLIENARSIIFAQPTNNTAPPGPPVLTVVSSAIGRGINQQGAIAPVSCSSENPHFKQCGMTLQVPDGFVGFARIMPIYHAAKLTITGNPGGASTEAIEFLGAQVKIDVTGKANDVLKRILVFRTLDDPVGVPIPDFALQSSKTQCKRFDNDGNPQWPNTGDLGDICDYEN